MTSGSKARTRHARLLPGLARAMPWRPWRSGLAFLVATGVLALEATREGVLPRDPLPPPAVPGPDDPVLAEVGTVPLRLSDLRAQAGPDAREASAADLMASDALAEAADQIALAQAAERAGLDQALEVRAALALARRRVLSEAYLDLTVRRAVTEEALRAAYEAEAALADADAAVSVRRILVSSEDEARDILARVAKGTSFAEMAQRRSLDMDTRRGGGLLPMTPLAELPAAWRPVLRSLAVGAASEPIEDGSGWHLLRVEARRGRSLPPFEDHRQALAARLREEALAAAASDAALAGEAAPVALALPPQAAPAPAPLATASPAQSE